ncbi:MAG: hypothetical protein M3X11_03680 [Acidobacteriota bacterium]|nr:hypothetical protein [Acidobacteriota bacterium]
MNKPDPQERKNKRAGERYVEHLFERWLWRRIVELSFWLLGGALLYIGLVLLVFYLR